MQQVGNTVTLACTQSEIDGMACRPVLIFLLFTVAYVSTYKILVYAPKFTASHVMFMGRIADTLHEAGHEVVGFCKTKTMRKEKMGNESYNGESTGNVRAGLQSEHQGKR